MDKRGDKLKEILTEMLRWVGVYEWPGWDYFKEEEWFRNHEWTREQEDDFTEWLVTQLWSDTAMRNEICEAPRKNKRHLRKVAAMFMFQFGWRVKDDSDAP